MRMNTRLITHREGEKMRDTIGGGKSFYELGEKLPNNDVLLQIVAMKLEYRTVHDNVEQHG